ncbi:hypothetical protein NMY22_g3956 [Coprinellus aureogranulatus]|nr:hypothetical protein NMY22_g3956 [Coprinellus aureogranulatus]
MGPRKIPASTVNGRAAPGTPSKGKGVVNGGPIDKNLVQSTIIDSIQAQPQHRQLGKLERNEFVREVLTLIHTDKSFVDGLYQRYHSQLA